MMLINREKLKKINEKSIKRMEKFETVVNSQKQKKIPPPEYFCNENDDADVEDVNDD